MAQLEHVFAAGVRFDTEVQYIVRHAGRVKYEKLPMRHSSSARANALTCLLQCLVILGQLPLKTATQRLRRALPTAVKAIDDDSMLAGIRTFDATITAELVRSSEAQEIGGTALRALRAGLLCMVQFESRESCRWATVIGVELNRTTGEARALLLLDASESEPWACGHNARIELQAAAGRSVHASAGFTLNCRCLTGGASAIRLHSLVVLGRRASSAA